MPVNKAKNYYLGKEGAGRMNCAQSVICAFKDLYDLDEGTVEKFRSFGGGRAPGGVCGAYYAARHLLEGRDAGDKCAALEKLFLEQAGGVKCLDIKAGRKFSCLDCIEKCAESLIKI